MHNELRTFSIVSLYQLFKEETLIIQHAFQRPYVWSEKAQVLLIDTILRNLPMPLILLRQRLDVSKGKVILEVLDGQQRLRTIFDFLQNKIRVPINNVDSEYMLYEELSLELKQQFMDYQLPVSIMVGVDDVEVLDVFTRLNQYSAILSQQEILEARFPGAFANTVSQLSLEHMQFWKKNRIFSETMIARKKDAELVSQLIVAMLDGLQNGKHRTQDFYEIYSGHFPMSDEVIRRFRSTIDNIAFIFEAELPKTIFKKTQIFYSLFCVFVDCKYGIPCMNLGKISITEKNRGSILRELKMLSERVQNNVIAQDELPFLTNSVSPSLAQRRLRHLTIWRVINSAAKERFPPNG